MHKLEITREIPGGAEVVWRYEAPRHAWVVPWLLAIGALCAAVGAVVVVL